MILGLDVSTSCTGWSLLTLDGSLVSNGYIPLTKHKDMLEKAETVRKELKQIADQYNVTRVCIEENLQAFRPGFSSAKTLMTLARFNGIVSYICCRDIEVNPEFINVNVARKSLNIAMVREKICGIPTKKQIFNWVSDQIKSSNYKWPKRTMKSGPRKGQVVLENGCYDIADAYVIARSGLISEQPKTS